MSGLIRNSIVTVLIAFCLANVCRSQDESALLVDGGKWRTDNKNFNPQDESSPRYVGYEFERGLSQNALKLKITGYLPKKSQWQTLWEGYYSWDKKKKQAIYTGVGPDGAIEAYRGTWAVQDPSQLVRLEQPKGIITFMSTRDGNFEVYSMKASGDSLVNLTCNKASDYAFSYAPGRRLVFNTNRDGNEEIYIMEADGKKVTNLTNNPAGDRNASVSPDGSKIVFGSYRDHKEPELYLMDIDGLNVKRLTSNDKYEDAASWSPDGKKIVFSRDEIIEMDIASGTEKQLTDHAGFDGGPQYSPDATRIAFYSKADNGKYDIFLMNADGSNVVNLTGDDFEDYSPSWSPDGKWIAYTSGSSSNYDVWVINVGTRIKYRLTTQPKRDESPIWR